MIRMVPRHAHAECGERYHGSTPRSQHVLVLSVATFSLGVALGIIGLIGASPSQEVRHASGSHAPAETSQAASRIPADPAQFPVALSPAFQSQGRVTTVGLVKLEPAPDEDPCDLIYGPLGEYCSSEPEGGDGDDGLDSKDLVDLYGKDPEVVAPPKGETPSSKDKPHHRLTDYSITPSGVSEPLKKLLGWLVWASSGGCMAGIMIVGIKMGLKHKRSEFGAHATGLSWVAVACIVGPGGVAASLMYYLITPT